MPNTLGKHMSVRLYLQIDWRRSIFLADFFTLFRVPLSRDSLWSNKRSYGAATHLQILQPIVYDVLYV